MAVDQYFDKTINITLSGSSINIQGEQGWAQVSIHIVSGTIAVTGATGMTIGGVPGETVNYTEGMDITFGSGISAVDDLTIDATAGVVVIVGVSVRNPN
ncbi:MAG: hypothetical protein PHT07_15150 [Paludibacter sp.]|nr:hypothetical protein [Paludibacter sp.]